MGASGGTASGVDAVISIDRPSGGRTEGDPRRVLIVEDEALVAIDLRRRLTRLGYEVVGIADNHDDALSLFVEQPADLVMMDIHIAGEVDGIATARDLAALADVPVVFLTAYGDPATIARAVEASAFGYLIKPFDERSLAATLAVAFERHAAERRVRLPDTALASAGIGVSIVDVRGPDLRLVYANPAFVALSGGQKEQLVGQKPTFLAANPDDEGVVRLREAVSRRSSAQATVHGRRLTGEDFWSNVTVSPILPRSGAVTHVVVCHVDISRQREAEQALADNQRLDVIGRLSAGIAHDFNNVLAAILAFASLAADGLDDPERRADLDEVVNAAKRGAVLTRKLLDFSRKPDADATLGCDLNRVISDAFPLLRHLAGTDNKIELRIDPEPLPVHADSTAMEQILLNLVVNARDAMASRAGRVVIAASRPKVPTDRFLAGRYVRLEVTDDGAGMDDATRARIFDPLFTTKQRGAGTGLGLTTCKLLVERVGGEIGVTSAPGAGSTFRIDIPVAEQPSVPAEVEADLPLTARVDGQVCLLVEDDAPLRRAYARALAEVGFHVVEAASGELACRELDVLGSATRLLVCDMVLPGVGGATVVSHARGVVRDLPVLILTGFFEGRDANDVIHGAEILWKPFTPSKLARRALDAVLSREDRAAVTPPPAPPRRSPATGFRSRVALAVNDPLFRRILADLLLEHGLSVLPNPPDGLTAPGALAEVDLLLAGADAPDLDRLVDALTAENAYAGLLLVLDERGIDKLPAPLRLRASGFVKKPLVPSALLEEVERALAESRMARVLPGGFPASSRPASSRTPEPAGNADQLKRAIHGLYLAFQPVVRAFDQSIYGFEALLRSRSASLAGPEQLLAAAERLGQTEGLGRAARGLVAKALNEHPGRQDTLFVNLHPEEVLTHALRPEDDPLLPFAHRVVFDLAQPARLFDPTRVEEFVRRWRALGFRFALDGVGDAAVRQTWLNRLTPEVAKLDISLVRDIQNSRSKRVVVASAVADCRRVGTVIVAVGVETSAEAALMYDLGCELLQGYYFARPSPPFPEVRIDGLVGG